MLLRAAIVMLVMLNLGVAGWWWLQPEAQAAAQPRVETATLRLVSEVAAMPPQAEPAIAPESKPEPLAPPPVSTPAPAEAAAVCLRYGPFADAATRAAAAQKLDAAGARAEAYDSPVRGARGWNVSLPAQPSRAEALALADRLKAAGIGDLYVLSTGDAVNSIALGRFSSEAGARRRQQELQGKGVAAQIAPSGGSPAQYWLDARLPSVAARTTLAGIAPATALDCARLR